MKNRVITIRREFGSACFTGEYPTAIPTNTAKCRFEGKLSERRKK